MHRGPLVVVVLALFASALAPLPTAVSQAPAGLEDCDPSAVIPSFANATIVGVTEERRREPTTLQTQAVAENHGCASIDLDAFGLLLVSEDGERVWMSGHDVHIRPGGQALVDVNLTRLDAPRNIVKLIVDRMELGENGLVLVTPVQYRGWGQFMESGAPNLTYATFNATMEPGEAARIMFRDLSGSYASSASATPTGSQGMDSVGNTTTPRMAERVVMLALTFR